MLLVLVAAILIAYAARWREQLRLWWIWNLGGTIRRPTVAVAIAGPVEVGVGAHAPVHHPLLGPEEGAAPLGLEEIESPVRADQRVG